MKNLILIILVSVFAFSCGRGDQDTGLEFADNMYVSHPLDPMTKPEYRNFPYNPDDTTMAMIMPVEGAIARGQMPYNIPKDSFDLAAATLKNPFPASDKVMEEGAELYGRFCKHCHGDAGGGDGPIADPSKFPGIAKLNAGQVAKKAEGHIFHVITHGKGKMGSHASQLSPDERWKIVHHVMSLRK